MKKLNTYLKVSAAVMFILVFVFGCKKTEETYSSEKEATMIKEWLDTNVISNDIDTTSTGLYYIVGKQGTGAAVQEGDTVTVKYIGMFLNGAVFDSSSSFTYVHKATNQRMIQGWEEGIEVLNKGSRATFLIPSAKGYGAYGSQDGSIPPNTPLIFTIEVVDIK